MIGSSGQRAATLLEVTIALGIGAMLISVLGSITAVLVWLPSNRSDQVTVIEDLEVAQHWITRDANAAAGWSAGSNPTYGTLNWIDYIPSTAVQYLVTYWYDSANGYLMREEQRDGVSYATFAVAKHIANFADVTFTWNPSAYSVQVSITSTVITGDVRQGVVPLSETAVIMAALRPRSEVIVSPPGSIAVPTPAPGSATYSVASNPTLIAGAYQSGGAAQLQSADQSYYVANSSSGSPKEVVFTVQSQVLTQPPTISQIEVRYVGMSSAQNVTVSLYVQESAAGYPALADSAFTYNSDYRTSIFYLSPTALAYVNSLPSRVVTLKVATAGNSSYTLSSDQIIFVASP